MMQTEKHTYCTITPLEQQVRRIRWSTGVSETTARTIAGLYYGEGR